MNQRPPEAGIDFHVHVMRTRDISSPEARRLLTGSNPQLSFGTHEDDEFAPREVLERQLDDAGLRYAVVLPQESPAVGIDIPTRYVLDYCGGSVRLVPFASLNPLTEARPRERLRRWAEEGARGLKLYPSYQFFYPNSVEVYPLYETAAEMKWPVVFHTGTSIFRGSRLKYALPIHIDDVAVDFPDLNIVLAHAGRPSWTGEAATLARLHPNVFLDVAGLPPHNLLRYLPDLPRFADKVVFGSDWPSTPAIAQTVEGILDLGLGTGALDRMFLGTARRLLGVPFEP